MKFFEEIVAQVNKGRHPVCGDYVLSDRRLDDTVFILTDGIGSGVYANVSAIFSANRLAELYRGGVSQREAAEMAADSMHRARDEDMPFAAFSFVKLLSDGQFTIYSYEAPPPLLISEGQVTVLPQRFFTSGYETVAECAGSLQLGDTLLLCSDGVTQAGMGHGLNFGLGAEGLASYILRHLPPDGNLRRLAQQIIAMTASLSGNAYVDDTTVAMIHCRRAKRLTVFSGPPASRGLDAAFARRFTQVDGQAVICGSTTADIIARETGREIKMVGDSLSFGSPPEYRMNGAAMVTEGAMVLNQTLNIIDENPARFREKTPPERLAQLMWDADVISFVLGGALNNAHGDMVFKQVGLRPRRQIINLLASRLRDMGKLVSVDEFN